MSILALREIPDDSELRREWDALAFETHSPQVFYTYEWARAVHLAYGESLCPLLLLWRDDDGRLAGVAALAAPKDGPVSFLCATTGDYCDFVVRAKDAAIFTAQVFEKLRQMGYRDIVLTNFPEDSPCYANLDSTTRGFHRYARTAYWCAQLQLAKIVEDSGKPALPRQKMVRRSLRAMGGGAALPTISEATWEKMDTLLPEFFRAHVARFAFTGRISNLAQPERREFLLELAKLLGPSGWLCVTRLNAGARTVAWNYGFKFCGTTFWYQPTFANDFEKYSPGVVLLSKLIEEAAQDSSMETVDLGLGAEGYKDAFANASRRTMYVTLHGSRFKQWREMARYRLVAMLKTNPSMQKFAGRIRKAFRSSRERFRSQGAKETIQWAGSRLRRLLWAHDEVFFYEMTNANPGAKSGGLFLKAIDFDTLADAALQNANDEGTMAYLLRCAERLRTNAEGKGYALSNAAGELLHFTWAGPFENFYWSELNSQLPTPVPGALVLFDSWTPVSQRGRGYYGPTLGLVVAKLREEGKRSWGFSASTNTSSVRGLEKAGFRRDFSVFRRRFLWRQKVVQKNAA